MKIRGLSILFLGVGVLVFSSEIQAKQMAVERFLEAYDRTKTIVAKKRSVIAGKLQWFLPESPWPQYLRQQFEEGLGSSQQKQYLSAQQRYACEEVATLDRIGFINLYPFLTKIFNRADVLKTFGLIVSNTSNGYNRCLTLKRIASLLSVARGKNIPIGPHDLGIKDIRKAKPLQMRPAYAYVYNYRIQHELKALVGLAFCHSYPPALSDLLQFTRSPSLLELPPRQTYRLIKQAQAMGISTAEFDGDFELVVRRMSPVLKAKVNADIKQNMSKAETTMIPILNRQCQRDGFLRAYAFVN